MADAQFLPDSRHDWLSRPCRAYLVHGEDQQSIGDACQQILAHRLPTDAWDFDLDVLDAEEVPVNAIVASMQRLPLLGDLRVVLVRSCHVFRGRERARDAEALATAIMKLHDQCCVVLALSADAPGVRRGPTIVNPKLDAAVRDVGMVVHCPLLKGRTLVTWIARYVAMAGKRITEEAAGRLADKEQADRVTLSRELDKLIAYVGERPRIELSDVDAVATHDPEDVMFRLVSEVSARRTGPALVLLRTLAQYEARPQALAGRFLALLNRQLRLVYQMRELQAEGVRETHLSSLPPEVQAQLPGDANIATMAWKARDYARDAGRWTREELARAFEMMVRCDAANKGDESGSEDVLANLEVLIVRLCDRGLLAA